MLLFGEPGEPGYTEVSGFRGLLLLAIWVFYFPGCESLFGKTLGHWALKLKVVNIYGNSPSFIDTLKRRITDAIELSLLGIPAFILISKTQSHQRLGDVWAETYVIKERNRHLSKSHRGFYI